MKNRKRVLIGISILVGIAVIILGLKYGSIAVTKIGYLGQTSAEINRNAKLEIAAKGKTVEILEANVDMIILNSDGSLTREEAINEIAREQIKYNIAVERGYSVSDAEIDAYISNFREIVSGANGEDAYREFIKSYGKTEDEYWNDVREPLRKELTVGKMMNQYRTQTVQGNVITYSINSPEIDRLIEERLRNEDLEIYAK